LTENGKVPRVVPTQVVGLIDKLFPSARDEKEGNPLGLSRENSIQVAAVLKLIEQIPPELLTLSADQYAEYISSSAALTDLIEQWRARDFQFQNIRGLRKHSPIFLIRQALDICPDEFPAAGTAELSFIADPDLRENLRKDIGTVNTALSNNEWKAATVLSGSVIEALLLWALEQRPPGDIQSAVKKLLVSKLPKTPENNLEEWVLYQYIEVAAELKVISDDTATAARLAKDFRNLIHPGRAKRFGQECNRGTALSAVAALEHVVNDLTV
jgi:hypothetical protein